MEEKGGGGGGGGGVHIRSNHWLLELLENRLLSMLPIRERITKIDCPSPN